MDERNAWDTVVLSRVKNGWLISPAGNSPPHYMLGAVSLADTYTVATLQEAASLIEEKRGKGFPTR